MSAYALINRSVEYSEIAHARHEQQLAETLWLESEDHVETEEICEYWGMTDEGEEWRVHLEKSN